MQSLLPLPLPFPLSFHPNPNPNPPDLPFMFLTPAPLLPQLLALVDERGGPGTDVGVLEVRCKS